MIELNGGAWGFFEAEVEVRRTTPINGTIFRYGMFGFYFAIAKTKT